VPTLYLTRGLPASGKTTWARALVASRRPGRIVRVNRDDLRRSMVDPDYAAPVDAVERVISAAERRLVQGMLQDGVDVVVDATNLRAAVARSWLALAEECGAEWHVEDVVADLEDCVRRDAARPERERVGEERLRDLHARFVDPTTGRLAPLAPPRRPLPEAEPCQHGPVAHENEWYFCLKHHQVEPWDGCRAADRLGPYPDKETAAHALEIAEQRNKAADKYDES
jgi:predicted kinase